MLQPVRRQPSGHWRMPLLHVQPRHEVHAHGPVGLLPPQEQRSRPQGLGHRPAGAKNILLVMADDLRPNLGFLHPFMITPAMDRLVARGMLFARAYVQQQVRPSCHRFF